MQQISIYTCFAPGHSIEARIAAIKDAGFDAVCLDFEKELEPTETSWQNQVHLAQKYALPIENVHLTGSGMSAVWDQGTDGDDVIERLSRELHDMAQLGIKVGVAHVTWGHARPAGAMEIGLKRYERAAEAAEKYGVKLALENSVYPEYVRYLLDHLKSPAVGFCYDSGHEYAFSKGENYLESYADRLIAMHLHDNDGVHDLHQVPMCGKINWQHVVSCLKSTSLFQRMLTLECVIADGQDMHEGLREAYQAGKKLTEMV